MKKNCQIWTAERVFEEFFSGLNPDTEYSFDENGCFRCEIDVASGAVKELSPDKIAERINMPLWEIVMVDNGGFDDYALLFYEECCFGGQRFR